MLWRSSGSSLWGKSDRRGAQRSSRRTSTTAPRCSWVVRWPPSGPSRQRTRRPLVWSRTAVRQSRPQGLRGGRLRLRFGVAWTSTACCAAGSPCSKRWTSGTSCSPRWGWARRCSSTAKVGGTGPALSMDDVCVGVLRMRFCRGGGHAGSFAQGFLRCGSCVWSCAYGVIEREGSSLGFRAWG